MMAPATPKTSKVHGRSPGTSSSQKKMKQASLLSFFGKSTTPVKNSQPRSPSAKIERVKPNENAIKQDKPNTEKSTLFVKDELDETASNIPDTSPLQPSIKREKTSVNYAELSEDEDDEITLAKLPAAKKRKMRAVLSDEDDEEFIPKADESMEDVNDNDEHEEEEDDDLELLALANNKPKMVNKPMSPPKKYQNSSLSTSSKNNKFNKQNEERYQWLVHVKDADGRDPSDPDYDPRTLYIPPSAWNKFTAFEKQYWEIKSKMWDCIVFFKKGKFFELYEKDAMLGNQLFDLKIAGGGRANMQLAGIPEMSFNYWASQFIQLGFKVAKVDQNESMLAKEMREGSKGIVKRELQYVLTSGTLTDGDMIHTDLATYCLAIKEEAGNFYEGNHNPETDKVEPAKYFGVSLIDTSTGEIQLLEIEDDAECTRLDTLLSQVKPKEVIMEKHNLSSLATKIVKFNSAPQAIFNELKPIIEFYDFATTSEKLTESENKYFPNGWPDVLKRYMKDGKTIALNAFGGLLYYLNWLQLDESLISLGNIKEYSLIQSQNSLVLDGVTLQNLEIFNNTFDGTEKGTLFSLFCNTITPMGKRMMKKWLMHPLLHINDINKRLDSVDQLISDVDMRDRIETLMSKLPDLERLLARVHSHSLKVKQFEKVITAFEMILKLTEEIDERQLVGALSIIYKSIPKELSDEVGKWANAFDRMKAVNEDVIVPHKGIEPEFDKSLEYLQDLENQLQDLLISYRKQLKNSAIQYKDLGKEIYTIEIPISATKNVPKSWIQMGANKTSKKYYSNEVKALARKMAEARESHKILEDDLKRRLCSKFDSAYYSVWLPTVTALCNIDCLIALARTSESIGFPNCRPVLTDHVDSKTGLKLNGFMKFKSLRHPCFKLGSNANKEFIANDVELGNDLPRIGLLTGANAAGKSTVLRMACVAVIMAQMGCYVPCESAILTPVDRIMTRLGANDNIMQGKSTFFVELSETKKILDLATNRSLLVLDELGRGGSSSDGFAIAESVLYQVATHIQSLGFFATHYASLGISLKSHPQIRPLKMSIMVDDDTRHVTFLYKLVDGQSEGSFGMHVASMCGIPKSVVDNAQRAADELEHTSRLKKELEGKNSNLNENGSIIPIGLESDIIRLIMGDGLSTSKRGTGDGVLCYDSNVKRNALSTILKIVETL